jgi:hypothetical protein
MDSSLETTSNGQTAASTAFLHLPPELRNMIYRLLVCDDCTLARGSNAALHPAILRTCHQIHTEARSILYGENVWEIQIMGTFGDEIARFMNSAHFGEYIEYPFQHLRQEMRKFRILVRLDPGEEPTTVRSAVRKVAKALSSIPLLTCVDIELRYFDMDDVPTTLELGDPLEFCHVLQGFSSLRNVRKVLLNGVPPVYAKYLTRKMTGSAPLDYLPSLYDALEEYGGRYSFCQDSLSEACDAMEAADISRFKAARAEIVKLVSQYMAKCIDTLYSQDGTNGMGAGSDAASSRV